MTVYAELSKVLKSKYKPGEDVQKYLMSLVIKAENLSDSEWDKLSSDAQEWLNDAVEASDRKETLPLPKGLEVTDDDDDDDDEEDDIEDDNVVDTADEDDDDDDSDEDDDSDSDDEDDEEEEAPRASKPVKNGKSGKHATKAEAKPAKKGKAAAAPAKKEKVTAKATKEVKGKGKAVKAAAKPGKAAKPAKAAKPEKAAKADKPKKAGGSRRGGAQPFPDNAKIKIINKAPHREGSKIAERYAQLKNGMTYAEARKAGLSALDLRCDVERGNIEIK